MPALYIMSRVVGGTRRLLPCFEHIKKVLLWVILLCVSIFFIGAVTSLFGIYIDTALLDVGDAVEYGVLSKPLYYSLLCLPAFYFLSVLSWAVLAKKKTGRRFAYGAIPFIYLGIIVWCLVSAAIWPVSMYSADEGTVESANLFGIMQYAKALVYIVAFGLLANMLSKRLKD